MIKKESISNIILNKLYYNGIPNYFQYKVRIFDKKEKTLRGYFTRLSGYSQSLSPKFVYLHALQCATTQGRVWYALPCARHLFLTANYYVLPCTSNRDCETYQEVTHGFYGAPLTLAVFVPLRDQPYAS